MMHPNKIHFCAINKRSVTEFRLLSDKNPIFTLPPSFSCVFHRSSADVFIICVCLLCPGQATEVLRESNILYRVIWLNDCMLLLILLQKRYIWFPSPGLTAWHRSACHPGSVTLVPVFLAFYLVYIYLSKYYFFFFIAVSCDSAQNSICQKRVTNSTSVFLSLFIYIYLMAPLYSCLKGEI